MPRGGRRQPTPGRSYSNRTDLQLATGQPYGQEKKLADAVAAVPAQGAPTPAAAPQPATPPGHDEAVQALAGFTPRPVTPLTAPTERPGEPVMTSPSGPAQVAPLLAATASLNALGGSVSPQAAALRAALNAHQANQAAQ